MTREQAINYLFSCGFTNEQVGEVVRALTYDPTTKNDLGVDCISRQATINAVKRIHPVDTDYDCTLYDKVDVMYVLDEMPSVTPQPRKGHWILDETDNSITCDKCGCLIWANDISNGEAYYCPHCGAKMEVEE